LESVALGADAADGLSPTLATAAAAAAATEAAASGAADGSSAAAGTATASYGAPGGGDVGDMHAGVVGLPDGDGGAPPFPLVASSSRCATAIETLQRDLSTVTAILGELKRHPHKYPRFKLEHLAGWGPAERAFYKKYKK